MTTEGPWLAVLCGPSGSGKSTLAAQLVRRTGCLVASNDALRLALHGRQYPRREEWVRSRELVYALAGDVARRGVSAGFSIVVDGVNATPEVRHRFVSLVPHGRSMIIGFETAFDNDGVWAERGYDRTAAAAIRRITLAEFVAPTPSESGIVQTISSAEDLSRLLADWPFGSV